MPKKEVKKNNKGTKAETSKKVETKKVTTPKEEPKVIEKEVEVKKEVKEKKGLKTFIKNNVLSNTPFVVCLCVIALLVALLILTLCFKRVPKTKNGSEILATIDGKTITVDELYEELKENYGTDSLMNLIDEYIADKEVEITKDDEKYVQEVVDYYKEYADYYETDLKTFLENYVGLTGISTEEEFYEFVLKDYKKTLTVTKYISDKASKEDLKEYYEENYSDKLTAKHILIEVDPEAEDTKKAEEEAYEKAKKLISELKNTDKDKLDKKFEELAADNSDDTGTYEKGGLIEDFGKKDVVEEFWDAAYELEDGKYTKEPVKTSYGYHIILKVSSTPVEEYDEIKDEVKKAYAESLIAEDANLSVQKWDEIRNLYNLSIKDDFIKKLYKKTVNKSTSTDEESEKTEEKTKEKTEEKAEEKTED